MDNQSNDSVTPPLSEMPNPTGRLYSHYDENGKLSYSTEPPNAETAIPETPIINKKRRGWSKSLQFFLFLLIISALGLSYYSLNQIFEIGKHVGQQIAIIPTNQHDNATPDSEISKPDTSSQLNVSESELSKSTTENSEILEPEIVEKTTTPIVNNAQLNQVKQTIQDLTTKQQDLAQGLSTTRLEQDETKLLLASTQEFIDVTKAQLESTKAQFELTKTQLESTKAQLQSQNQVIANIEQKLQQQQKTNTESQITQDWTLSEIDYLLNLAQYRLNFMQDSKTALSILNVVKEKLQQWSQPQLSKSLIAQIEQNITTLQAEKSLNIQSISQQLSNYIEKIPQLTLVKTATAPITTDLEQGNDKQPLKIFSMLESWGDVTSVIWNEMKQLVTISHNENVDVGLLTDTQSFFVQQHLGLKLESARLALLKSDFSTFQTILTETIQWLNQYYDQNSTQVIEIQDSLKELQQMDFLVHYPDLSKTLEILHRTKAQ